MINCPFTSTQYGSRCECMGRKCALWDDTNNKCLIALALNKYIASEIMQDKIQQELKDITFNPDFPFEEV